VSNFVFRVDCVVDETFRADALLCSHYWLGTANPGRGILRHYSGFVLETLKIRLRIGYVMHFEFALRCLILWKIADNCDWCGCNCDCEFPKNVDIVTSVIFLKNSDLVWLMFWFFCWGLVILCLLNFRWHFDVWYCEKLRTNMIDGLQLWLRMVFKNLNGVVFLKNCEQIWLMWSQLWSSHCGLNCDCGLFFKTLILLYFLIGGLGFVLLDIRTWFDEFPYCSGIIWMLLIGLLGCWTLWTSSYSCEACSFHCISDCYSIYRRTN